MSTKQETGKNNLNIDKIHSFVYNKREVSMKLEGYSKRVKVGIRRDRLLPATLDLIRDIKSSTASEEKKSLAKKMEKNQRLIKKYSDEIFSQYSSRDIDLFPGV